MKGDSVTKSSMFHPEYFSKKGGTLEGNIVIEHSVPTVLLSSIEKQDVGRSYTRLSKNASDTADHGTILSDYPWGDYGSTSKHTAIRILSSASDLKDRAVLLDYQDGGSYVLYRLYGEHNKPTLNDFTGTIPINKGGTGQTDPLSAITALGGLSATSIGTAIPERADIDTYITPGTYNVPNGTVAETLEGNPPYRTGGFKLYVFRGYQTSLTFQMAQGASILPYIRYHTASGWSDWSQYAYHNHSHGSIRYDGSIAQDTDPEVSDRLVITDASDGSTIKRGNIRFDGETTTKALTPKGTWETFMPASGGTLSGNVSVKTESTTPAISLIAPEKPDVGSARTVIYKNANASRDNGTQIVDYSWGDGSSNNPNVRLILNSQEDLSRKIMLRFNEDSGTSDNYLLYGTHNKPTLNDVTGLAQALAGKSDTNHTHPYLPLTGGTLTGDISIEKTNTVPRLTLLAAEKENVGRSRTTLYKNASATTDAGTVLSDYSWNDGGASNPRLSFILSSNQTDTKNYARLVNYDESGASTTYYLYGTHNKPTPEELGAANASHTHAYLPLRGGTLTGSLKLDPESSSIPMLELDSVETTDGFGVAKLAKNANSEQDLGTYLADFVNGDGDTLETKNARLVLRASMYATGSSEAYRLNSLERVLSLVTYKGDGSSGDVYRLYGEHNRPWVRPQVVLEDESDLNTNVDIGWYRCHTAESGQSIKHTPGYDPTTLVNTSMTMFNLTVGQIGPVQNPYVYQELLQLTGKRWYRYTMNPTATNPTWTEWTNN